MNILQGVSRAVDSVIGAISPRSALQRVVARHNLQIAQRMYAAARPTSDAGGWLPLDQGPNAIIRSSAPTVRARIRQLVRDFPYFARAVNVRCAFVVGNGIRLQMRMYKTDSKGKDRLDTVKNAAIEAAWESWAAKADTSGRLSFYDLQELAERQKMECGEYFFVKRYINGEFRLQPMEPDRLSSLGATPAAGCDIEQGVEFDLNTGAPVAYHFLDDSFTPDTPGSNRYSLRSKRVPADQIIHGYKVLRPGQMRGISPLVSAVMVAGDLADLLESELSSTRLQSKYLGFVTTQDIPRFQEKHGVKKVNGRSTQHLDMATIEYLNNGETIELAKMDRQGTTFEPFLRFNLRTLAITAGITTELITGDYTGISYSNLRGIRQDLAVMLKPEQSDHIKWLCDPVFSAWLEWERLKNPGLLPYPRTLQPWETKWIAPGQEPVDPLKEINAFKLEWALKTRSPQEYVALRGRDFEELLDECKQAQEMAAERGLTVDDVIAQTKTNPAALMEDGNADAKKAPKEGENAE
ncbi:phage portal protein [Desulfovibrio desulfuricans]|uniref:phage portal protein n=1 Tax=Desulfovibrio desulfuricans TaxID=876 RepID=UPI00177E7EB0|nr:phage portal protein [Desulfovibrio desulfuricans]MBD8896209.1 phage portal protein [Desulfovibrio desulfuricans]